MCLVTKQTKPQIAEENIRVWKIIDRFGHPYVIGNDYRYKRGFNYPKEKFITIERTSDNEFNMIHGGVLHAYTHVVGSFDERKYDVVEMYIPKGTEYYTSASGNETCAKCLYMPHKHKKLRAFFGLKEAIEI